jgi:hypothetical protein
MAVQPKKYRSGFRKKAAIWKENNYAPAVMNQPASSFEA